MERVTLTVVYQKEKDKYLMIYVAHTRKQRKQFNQI